MATEVMDLLLKIGITENVLKTLGNRWLPQTTRVGCLDDLLSPSPPAEKAPASQYKAGESCADNGAGDGGCGAEINAFILKKTTHTLLVVDQSLSKTGGFKSEGVSEVRKVQ
jgi:hypothetical protein